MKKKIALIGTLILALLAASVSAAFAVSGNATSYEVFHVHAYSEDASIKLRSVKGIAYVEKRSVWGTNPVTGYEEEDTHGFYTVRISGPGKNETIQWVPSVTTTIDVLGSGFESGSSLKISFPYAGDYTVSVEAMDNSEASSKYWLVDWLLAYAVEIAQPNRRN